MSPRPVLKTDESGQQVKDTIERPPQDRDIQSVAQAFAV